MRWWWQEGGPALVQGHFISQGLMLTQDPGLCATLSWKWLSSDTSKCYPYPGRNCETRLYFLLQKIMSYCRNFCYKSGIYLCRKFGKYPEAHTQKNKNRKKSVIAPIRALVTFWYIVPYSFLHFCWKIKIMLHILFGTCFSPPVTLLSYTFFHIRKYFSKIIRNSMIKEVCVCVWFFFFLLWKISYPLWQVVLHLKSGDKWRQKWIAGKSIP